MIASANHAVEAQYSSQCPWSGCMIDGVMHSLRKFDVEVRLVNTDERAVRAILVAVRDAGVARVMVDRFNPYPASVSRFLKAAPAEAAQALRGYVAGPLDYLDRLRGTVTEAAADLKLGLKVLF